MTTGSFLAQNAGFAASHKSVDWKFPWIRSYKKKKSLCGFSASCVGQQNLEGGNSRLILLSVSGVLEALTLIQHCEEGRRCQTSQLASQNAAQHLALKPKKSI